MAQAAEYLLTHPSLKQVIFCDTCILLDILRIPHRNVSRHVLTITEKLNAIQSSIATGETIIVVQRQNIREFNRNKKSVIRELLSHLENANDFLTSYKIIEGASYTKISSMEVLSSLRDRLYDLMRSAVIIGDDMHCQQRAMARALVKRVPSKRGAIADVTIYEHMLCLSLKLFEGGFSGDVFFITSNTKDFGPEVPCLLQKDVDHYHFKYVTDWRHV